MNSSPEKIQPLSIRFSSLTSGVMSRKAQFKLSGTWSFCGNLTPNTSGTIKTLILRELLLPEKYTILPKLFTSKKIFVWLVLQFEVKHLGDDKLRLGKNSGRYN